jgi:hypothetical protein
MVPPPEHRWKPGASANPGGRPKVDRSIAKALVELRETEGADEPEVEANFRKARGAKLCGVDFEAIRIWKRSTNDSEKNGAQVAAFEAINDRTEGKVGQLVQVEASQLLDNLAASTGLSREALLAKAKELQAAAGGA